MRSTMHALLCDELVKHIGRTFVFMSSAERDFMRECVVAVGDKADQIHWLSNAEHLVAVGKLRALPCRNAAALGLSLRAMLIDSVDGTVPNLGVSCARDVASGSLHVYAGHLVCDDVWTPIPDDLPLQTGDDILALYPFLDGAERDMLRYIISMPLSGQIRLRWVPPGSKHRWHMSGGLEPRSLCNTFDSVPNCPPLAGGTSDDATQEHLERIMVTATIEREPKGGDAVVYYHVNVLS